MIDFNDIRIQDYEDKDLREAYDKTSEIAAAAEQLLRAAQEESRKAWRSVKPERRLAASKNLDAALKVYYSAFEAFHKAENDLQCDTGRRIGIATGRIVEEAA